MKDTRFVRWAGAISDRALLIAGLVGTFALMRASLFLRPNADLNLGGYNIHHLHTGVLITTLCAIPLAVASPRGLARKVLVAGLGVGLSLALDEVVYLIATDGSNASYLTPISWIGGIVLVAAAAAYALMVQSTKKGASQD